MSNNSSVDSDNVSRDSEEELIVNSALVGDSFHVPLTETPEILPGLIFDGQNTVVLVDPDLYDCAQMFAIIIAYSVAVGGCIPPLGTANASGVVLDIGAGNRRLAAERFAMLHDRSASELLRRRERFNLHTTRSNRERNGRWYLNQFTGQKTFKKSRPDGCKLAAFADANWRLTTNEKDPTKYNSFASFQSELNEKGIATLSFVHGGKRSAVILENEFLWDGTTVIVELTKDAAAPREFGGGFNVVRRKISEHDPVPLFFQFWYRVIDHQLTFGWECRNPYDATTAKQVEMSERQRRVRDCVAMGMQQKDIATTLEVDAATVSRDVAKIKDKEQRSKPAEGKPAEKPVGNPNRQGEAAAEEKPGDN